ncbi:MAG: hypothetical protein QNJ56_05615 [Gammaproteobacteria bacterium]|nr:hypothetical protein [Gammaproteobacteria bacterium]
MDTLAKLSWSRVFLILISSCLFLSGSVFAASKKWDDNKGCMSCHEGIERISDVKKMKNLTCVDCHKGDGDAKTEEAGHKGMYANPSDLRVVNETCGECHEEEVAQVTTSMHATMAGLISGTRYDAGTQDKHSKYATYDVKAINTGKPMTVASFKQIPSYDPSKPEGPENSIADDYLRNQCLRCHLWSDGHQRDGDYRASGCAACHMVYSDKATYEGGDKAIDKTKKDRPRVHRMTNAIPETQCIHCHNRGGRTGVSFIGTMESDGYGTPWKAGGGKQGKLHGKHYNHLEGDVHYERGMTCIDCHTLKDHHGDGYLYEKKEDAVEIRCETCHGTIDKEPDLVTAHGNEIDNVEKVGDKFILTAKLTGKEHEVPILKGAELSKEGHAAMVEVPSHMEKLECYACHARWAPQCYGCHAKQDVAKPNGDWLNTKASLDPSKAGHKDNREKTAFSWSESRSYLRWETPVLGINTKGKVSPFIPGCQLILTQVDGKEQRISNRVYTTVDGISGLSHNPIQPHTVSAKSRTCADCHMNSKAVGLGSGYYDIKDNFPDGPAPVDFELERIVTEDGKQLQATNHIGARPFNKEEIEKITKVGTCLACHGEDGVKLDGDAPDDMTHEKAIRKLRK